MKVRIRKASPGEKPRFVSKLNNLVNKAKGGKTAAVENFIESEIENGTDPEDVISKLAKYNIKGDAIDTLVYDAYDKYEDDQNYYNAKKEKAPYEAPAPYENETPEEPVEETNNSELYGYNDSNIGLESLKEDEEEEEEEYAAGGEFVGNSIFPKQTKPYFIGLDAAPFDSEFARGGSVPSKSKFVKSYVKQLKKAAEGDQVNNSEFFLPPNGDINDPMGNYTKQNQMFAGAVKQIGNDAMLQKQAEEAYQNMFTKETGGSQEPHDWIDELHGYGESLQHAMPNMDQNTLNSFIMKDQYARGGRVRRANKALFGVPFAIPGVDTAYEFGPLGGIRKATADWDVQALGNLVNFLPGGMNMLPGMMTSGWKSVTYPAQVRKKVIQTVNNKALDEVASNTPGSDATQKQKSGKKKELTCPPGSFYDAAKDMCVDMNGIPMPSKTELPSAEELMINPWGRPSKPSSQNSVSNLGDPYGLVNTSIDQKTYNAIKGINAGDFQNRANAYWEYLDSPEYLNWINNDKSTPEEDAAMQEKEMSFGNTPMAYLFHHGYDNYYGTDVDPNNNYSWNNVNMPTLQNSMENGGYVDQAIIDPNAPELMKFIYGGDDQYAMGGDVLPKAETGFEAWARNKVNLDGSLKKKPSLSYDATNPFKRKNPLDLKAPTIEGTYGNVPPIGAPAPNPTTNQGPAGPVQPPNQNQTINTQQLSPQQIQQYMQYMQQMGMGRPQKLGFGLSRDFNYTQGFSPNWNVPEGTQHMRQETYKDRGKWYNPFDTKRITDWYADPDKQGAAAPGTDGSADAESDNNIPDPNATDNGIDYKNSTIRKINRAQRRADRQSARGREQFPEDFSNTSSTQPTPNTTPGSNNVSNQSQQNNEVQGNPQGSINWSTMSNPGLPNPTNIVAGAGSGTTSASANPANAYSGSGIGAMERTEAFDNPQQSSQTSPAAPASSAPTGPVYNSLYPAGTTSSTGISSVYEPEQPASNSSSSVSAPQTNIQLNNPGLSNPYQKQNPLALPNVSLDRTPTAPGASSPQLNNPGLANPYSRPNPLALGMAEGGFIPSYMAYMAYGGDMIPMANKGITVNQPEFNDPNFVGRTIEQSAYTFDPKQMGADLFRGPASIFGMATSIGNAINNEKNVLDPARKQYRTSDAATANTGQSGFGSAEVTGSQMGDKGWYNQWGKNIENVGFEGNEVNTKMGGTGNKQYQKGKVYTLTLEQIKAIEAAGGKVEYLK